MGKALQANQAAKWEGLSSPDNPHPKKEETNSPLKACPELAEGGEGWVRVKRIIE